MITDIRIDDSVLQSKRVITSRDIYNILPEKIKEKVEEICVLIDNGQPVWIIFIKGDVCPGYRYYPHSGELIFDAYAKIYHFGKIYFGRLARYLRVTQVPEEKSGLSNKVYSIYFCTRRKMTLWGEALEYWMNDDEGCPGCSTEHHWFRRIKA